MLEWKWKHNPGPDAAAAPHPHKRMRNGMGTTLGENAPAQSDQRLISLDALRGFDMFWIIGGSAIVERAAEASGWPWLEWLAGQMRHAEWHGFTLLDLVFPLFMFLAGVSMPFSFAKRRERGETTRQLAMHVLWRGLLLVLLGMIHNRLLGFDWEQQRYPSVLGRIGLASMFAAAIVMNTRWRGQAVWLVGLLFGYWAAMTFIPVPGFGAGDLRPGHTLADYLDRQLLPGKLLHPTPDAPPGTLGRDPEGLFSTMPAIGTVLAGALAGQWLRSERRPGGVKALGLAVAGLGCVGLAGLWNLQSPLTFPINKNLWTSSFVLLTSGLSLLLLAAFYLVIDVWKVRAWAAFFVVIGCNSIFIYLAQRMINFEYTAHFLFDGITGYRVAPDDPRTLLAFTIGVVALKWLLLYGLYRKRLFVRL